LAKAVRARPPIVGKITVHEAERWVVKSADREPKPTTLQSQLLLVSRQSATNVLRMIVGAVAVAFLIAVGLAVYAFSQKNIAQRNARESKARELVTYATQSVSEDPERSILLAMQAVNATFRFGQVPVPAAEEALHQAILSSQIRLTLRGHTGPVGGVAFSSDGKRLATASQDGTAKVWDAANGRELLTLRDHLGLVNSVAFSPDNKRLATASSNNTVRVWDALTGQELLTLRDGSDRSDHPTLRAMMERMERAKRESMFNSARLAFSPDSKRLAITTGDKTVKIWNAIRGQRLLILHDQSETVLSVAYSPDGKYIGTSGPDGTANVWDALSGRELLRLRGHSVSVDGVAFWSRSCCWAESTATSYTSGTWIRAAISRKLIWVRSNRWCSNFGPPTMPRKPWIRRRGYLAERPFVLHLDVVSRRRC
jgi:WD40 repeat protein